MRTLKTRLEGLDGRVRRRAEPTPREGDSHAFAPLATGVVHDLYAAAPADVAAVTAFGLGLALQAAMGRPLIWGLHDMTAQEAGRPYAPGLNEMGLRPDDMLLVRARDIQSLLSVGEEALRNPAVGAVLLSAWGEARAANLTSSRRLALAARKGKATLFLTRVAAEPAPSAAETRWSVRAAASAPMEANAPGRPAFSATRLRHRGGGAPRTWTLEWDHERRVFVESAPLSGGLVSLAAQRPAGAGDTDIARRIA